MLAFILIFDSTNTVEFEDASIMSVEESYDKWAGQYDADNNKSRDMDRKATNQMLGKINFSKVLELGCGTGKNTIFLLEKAEQVIGIDFSRKMLDKARTKVDDQRVIFLQADITKPWEVDDGFADLITCNLVLEHVKDLNFIFKEAARKLQPNGHFFISELHPYKQYKGSKARFDTEHGTHYLETYTHHISDFLSAANNNNFYLLKLEEWFDEQNINKLPRLITCLFRQNP